MNYEISSSDVKNYDNLLRTSSPNSFTSVMENGVLVQYEDVKISTEVQEDGKNIELNSELSKI